MRNFNLDDDLKRHVKPGLIISAFTVFFDIFTYEFR